MSSDRPRREEENTEEPSESPGRFARLFGGVTSRSAAAWARVKARLGRGDTKADDDPESAEEEAPPRRRRAPSPGREEAEEAAAPPSGFRFTPRTKAAALYTALGLVCGSVGAGIAYAFLAQRLQEQAAELRQQRKEFDSQHQALTDSAKKYLDQQLQLVKTQKEVSRLRARLEEAEKAAAEKAKSERKADPPKPSHKEASCPASPEPKRNEGDEAPPPEKAAVRLPVLPPTSRTKPQAAQKSSAPANAGNCVVGKGRIGEVLKECIELFNRSQ